MGQLRIAGKASSLILLAGLAAAHGSVAAECPPLDDETVFAFFQRCVDTQSQAVLADVPAQARRNASLAQQKAETEMAVRPTAAAAETGFADRVNDSLSDFLTPFQFALQGVDTSEDRSALTLRFNTPQMFLGGAKFQATIAEPVIYEPLKEAIEESARTSEVDALLKDVGDLSNITYSVGWSFRRSPSNWERSGQILGRDPVAYEGLIAELYEASGYQQAAAQVLLDADPIFPLAERLARLAKLDPTAVMNTSTIGDLRLAVAGKPAELVLDELLTAIPGIVASELAARAKLPDESKITSLIANQPQLLLTVAATDPKEALGPRQTTASLRYEMGSRNFNRVLEDYQRALRQVPAETTLTDDQKRQMKLKAFEDVVKAPLTDRELRMFYGVTYKKFDDYDFEHAYQVEVPQAGGDPVLLDKTAKVTRPGEEEWTATLGYSQITGPGWCPTERRKDGDDEKLDCLFSFVVDALQVEGDGDVPKELKRQDRVIARLTYNVPVSEGVSVPFSLTYSNRAEFLKDAGDQLSAHVAISYKPPFGMGND